MSVRAEEKMVKMMDYRLHYAFLAGEDRLQQAMGERRATRPIRPHRMLRLSRRRSEDRS